jgi:hypothetical protein
MVGESCNTAKSIIGIEQLLTFRTVLIATVVTLGDVILLLRDDPAVCTIIGRYSDFNDEEFLGKRFPGRVKDNTLLS